jgi:fatty acid desaturase
LKPRKNQEAMSHAPDITLERGESVLDENELKALIRRALPADAGHPQARRIAGGVLVLLSVLATSLYLASARPSWPLALGVSVVLGNLYVTLMFYGHEVSHGTILRPGPVRSAFQYCAVFIYVVSPHLWKHWHNCTHHPNTNIPTRDPDCFPPLAMEEEREGAFAWVARRIVPGSGHWLSLFNLFIQFTLQGQVVLWRDSRGWRYRGFNRRRAMITPVVDWMHEHRIPRGLGAAQLAEEPLQMSLARSALAPGTSPALQPFIR